MKTPAAPMALLACVLAALGGGAAAQETRNAPAGPFEIQEVLERHRLWLVTDGAQGARADLRAISLEEELPGSLGFLFSGGLILRGADLRRADIRFARLRGVDLTDANLEGADLEESDLSRATLRGANLAGADLRRANLESAVLADALLHGAFLAGANLRGADLSGARCLSQEQAAAALIDAATRLPEFQSC